MVRPHGTNWQKTLWKFVTHPAVELVAAIVAVMLAAWFVVQTEVDLRHHRQHDVPLLFGHK